MSDRNLRGAGCSAASAERTLAAMSSRQSLGILTGQVVRRPQTGMLGFGTEFRTGVRVRGRYKHVVSRNLGCRLDDLTCPLHDVVINADQIQAYQRHSVVTLLQDQRFGIQVVVHAICAAPW